MQEVEPHAEEEEEAVEDATTTPLPRLEEEPEEEKAITSVREAPGQGLSLVIDHFRFHFVSWKFFEKAAHCCDHSDSICAPVPHSSA